MKTLRTRLGTYATLALAIAVGMVLSVPIAIWGSQVTLPYTFTTGSISASQLNSNFRVLVNGLNSNVDSSNIANESITSADILNGTIASADIATGGVEDVDILNGTIKAVDCAEGLMGSYDGDGLGVNVLADPNELIVNVDLSSICTSADMLTICPTVTENIIMNQAYLLAWTATSGTEHGLISKATGVDMVLNSSHNISFVVDGDDGSPDGTNVVQFWENVFDPLMFEIRNSNAHVGLDEVRATNATVGFMYIPAMVAKPTGTITDVNNFSSGIPLIVDAAKYVLYGWINGEDETGNNGKVADGAWHQLASDKVRARYTTNAAQNIPTGQNILNFEDKSFDRPGGDRVTLTTWQFTADRLMTVEVEVSVQIDTTEELTNTEYVYIVLYADTVGANCDSLDVYSVLDRFLGHSVYQLVTNARPLKGGDVVELSAGDCLRVELNNNAGVSVDLTGAAGYNYISITEL